MYFLNGFVNFGRICLFFTILNFLNCQHARVEFSPILQSKKIDNQVESKVILKQNYFFMGLLPRKIEYNESILCPVRGMKEIHQYSSLRDGVLEQITFGIYSPRSIEIICY